MGQITAHGNPQSSFSLSFFLLCVRRGFDEKILRLAVQHTSSLSCFSLYILLFSRHLSLFLLLLSSSTHCFLLLCFLLFSLYPAPSSVSCFSVSCLFFLYLYFSCLLFFVSQYISCLLSLYLPLFFCLSLSILHFFASLSISLFFLLLSPHLRGASKINLKKVNKKRMVTVRRVIIFLNISRHSLLI
jgi:hypothetical protein